MEKVQVGQRYGEWTVKELLDNYKALCACSCGKERAVNVYTLLQGKSTGCGHTMNRARVIDLVGRKFGKLTVKKYVGGQMWECECECGNTCTKHRNNLLDGRAIQCKVCSGKMPVDLKGKKFGHLEVLEYIGNKSWLCKCDCGNKKVVRSVNLLNGSTVSCGCWALQYTQEEIEQTIKEFCAENNRRPTIGEVAGLYDRTVYTINKYNRDNGINIDGLIDQRFRSYGERMIYETLVKLVDTSDISVGHWVTAGGRRYEIDLLVKSKNIGIEFNGSWWHCEVYRDKMYHHDKSMSILEDCGIRIIHVFDYELEDKDTCEKVLNIIKDAIREDKDILYARETKVVEVGQKQFDEFCEKYHLQGGVSSKVRLGLLGKNCELLEVMSFGHPRFETEHQWELLRLCTKSGTVVLGGAEKLLSHFIREYRPESIVTYSDISKFSGKIYDRLGFKYCGDTEPGYVWVGLNKRNGLLTRHQTTREGVQRMFGIEPEQTVDDRMAELSYFKCYNCGNRKYSMKIKEPVGRGRA